MTDKTKAIYGGWIAPYYDEDGRPDVMRDLRVKISDDNRYLPIVLRDEAAFLESEMPIDQAKALIDALQLAVAHAEKEE